MGTIPVHPMIVHFPIVLSILLPIFALGALWAIRRRAHPARAWALPLAVAVVLLGSAFVATQTGQNEEEAVERVVPENAIHDHEEAAERFLALAGIMVVVAGLGLARGVLGSAARLVATVGSLVVVFAGYQVGKAGGELVYEHNAGAAYAQSGTPGVPAAPGDRNEQEERGGDDD